MSKFAYIRLILALKHADDPLSKAYFAESNFEYDPLQKNSY